MLDFRKRILLLLIVISLPMALIRLAPARAEGRNARLLITPTPSPTVTPTPCQENTTLEVNPARTWVVISETLQVTVRKQVQPGGCYYATYDLTLEQVGEDGPLFEYDSPQTIGPGVGYPAIFRLTAIKTGAVTLQVTAYGEYNSCDPIDFCWHWAYLRSQSEPVNVRVEIAAIYLPLIFKER